MKDDKFTVTATETLRPTQKAKNDKCQLISLLEKSMITTVFWGEANILT